VKPLRRAFVVGGAHTTYLGKGRPEFVHPRHAEWGERHNPSLEEHLREATLKALEVAGVTPAQVERGYVSNFLGECFSKQGHLGSMLAAVHPDLEGKPFGRIEAACASGSAAIAAATEAICAGWDVVLVVGVEVETNVRGRDGVEFMARAAHYESQRELSEFTFPHLFARRTRAYKDAFGATDEDVAAVVLKAYQNAAKNPKALKHHVEMTPEHATHAGAHNPTFLEDPELRPHMKMSDSTQFTDGASAVVLCSEAGLEKLGIATARCTEILAWGHSTRALGAETDGARMTNLRAAAEVAYRDAGITAADVDLVELHDCFAISELQQIEALGLTDEGQAGAALREGTFDIDGRVPINTGGGLLGFGHPIGATGVKQVVEVWRQAQGLCEAYQVPNRPQIAVTSNLGGDDRTGIVMVHERCG